MDFVNAKSDIKLVDYVGYGHCCVCSNAAPYADTDLHGIESGEYGSRLARRA